MGVRVLKKALIALGIVLILQSLFALCLVSALQLLVLRNTPFRVTGASPVVNAVNSRVSLQTFVVPAKSFFGVWNWKPPSATQPRSSAGL
ncbi:hypothetical protein [Streptomyces sp. NBC_00207]|uniref:hypothetical protein n=1 Tax=Streptomyces sp. NBC_00207 TaxID=2903635 RepID=UPI00324B34BE